MGHTLHYCVSELTVCVLRRDGKPIGEWRGGSGYTIISGLHPDGFTYRVIVDAPPLAISFEEIVWPEAWQGGRNPADFCFSTSSVPQEGRNQRLSVSPRERENGKPPIQTLGTPALSSFPSPLSLYSLSSLFHPEEARKELENNADLFHLYRLYIEYRNIPEQGNRNTVLIVMTTFLYFTVGRERLLGLVKAFYETNAATFTDPLEQHMNEAQAHLTTLEADFLAKLAPIELDLWQHLPLKYQEAFRILRDLATQDLEDSPPGLFFISFANLARRLATSRPHAARILDTLKGLKVIEMVTKGEQYQKGVKARATRYRWILLRPIA